MSNPERVLSLSLTRYASGILVERQFIAGTRFVSR
jgi:hypothetical protein